MFFDTAVPVVQSCGDIVLVIITAIRGFVSLKEADRLSEAMPPTQGSYEVDALARNWSSDVDKPIYFLSYSMLENLGNFVSSNSLYRLLNELLELKKVSFPEIPSSSGVRYASGGRYQSSEYFSTVRTVGRSDEARRR